MILRRADKREFPHTLKSRATAISIFITIWLVLSQFSNLLAAVRKAPYLIYENNNTEMTVLWQLNSAASCGIEWGEDQTYSLGEAVTVEYGDDHQHKYVIAGLQAGQLYYYRVTADGQIYTGSFHAAPPSDAKRANFFIYGDSRSTPAVHDQLAAEMVATYDADPDFQAITLSVGDLVTDGDNEESWDSELFNPDYPDIQAILANTPLLAAMGNHEHSGLLFAKYLPYPFVDGHYWSYDYGPVHFTVVDQSTDYSPGSDQLAWIENDLASTNKPWKIIYFHRPGWSAGHHENDSSVQNYIQPLCLEYGVSVVFAGHNHYYARAVVDGIQHVTTGGGGSHLYTPNPDYPNIVATGKSYHFCRVSVENSLLHCEAVGRDGTIIDSFTVDKSESVLSHSQ